MKAWIAAHLSDPTNLLHGLGAITIAGEVATHWITGKPVDLGTIGAGTGCFGIGGTMDYFQKKAP